MRRFLATLCLLTGICTGATTMKAQDKIVRRSVINRNNPIVTSLDTLASLTVGNGGFAMTVDATGLQSFPEHYAKGVPLGTMSDWGWHSFPNPNGYQPREALVSRNFGRGHKELYAAQFKEKGRRQDASNWLRVNPHRLHLGTVGLALGDDPTAVSDVDERLDMWTGEVSSSFTYRGSRYEVSTVCHPEKDLIASSVADRNRTPICFRFAYPTGAHSDDACNWNANDLHTTTVVSSGSNEVVLKRAIDATVYYVKITWQGNARFSEQSPNRFLLTPEADALTFTCHYSLSLPAGPEPAYAATRTAAADFWRDYWNKGGIIDFSHCRDIRARELERRVVLSQYLMAVNDGGDTPPQETGLTYNSWFGKFHLEMIWWHQAQFALWGHSELLDRSLRWYETVEPIARDIARRQGFRGVRWMKMTDPSGQEAPSNIGSYLIWQQPHLIYLAELVYRANPTPEVLRRYNRLVQETAEFMASFVTYDKKRQRYILKGCTAAQETVDAKDCVNPPFELSYWHYALGVAQQWRERSGMPRVKAWDDIIARLSPLACNSDRLYLAAESATDTYTNLRMTSDHPALLGALGILPDNPLIDRQVMKQTLDWIISNWNWPTSWGWDFPMTAMTAARLGERETAVSVLLMPVQKNTYLPDGHNYQDSRLRVYLPGNGGLLTAVAMMCAGWDGSEGHNPGFPDNGDWDVRWEGLKPMP